MTRPITLFQRGPVVPLDPLNQLVDDFNRRSRAVPRPRQRMSASGSVPVVVARFSIYQLANDYLIARTVDDTDAPLQWIAKPDDLRTTHTSHNGVTFTYTDGSTRSATDGTTTETQVLTPPYVVGDVILALAPVVTGLRATINGTVTALNWIDLNITARQWAVSE